MYCKERLCLQGGPMIDLRKIQTDWRLDVKCSWGRYCSSPVQSNFWILQEVKMPFTPREPNRCKRCSGAVYDAEMKKDSGGGFWHKRCYTCKNCSDNKKTTKLDSTTCCDNAGNYISSVGNTFIFKMLRRHPIGNRAISVSSGQKPCTRINLSVLQSFFAFSKS